MPCRFDSARFESTKLREIEPTCLKMHCNISGSRVFYTASADLRRSREFSGVVRAERLFRRGLYRFSTGTSSRRTKRLFLSAFPAYPGIISNSIGVLPKRVKGFYPLEPDLGSIVIIAPVPSVATSNEWRLAAIHCVGFG
jgi:hypothetical protein